jgi:hypothetical protein
MIAQGMLRHLQTLARRTTYRQGVLEIQLDR